MPTRPFAPVARFLLGVLLLAAPARALEVAEVPDVRGMKPAEALAALRGAGFDEFELHLDGSAKSEAEIAAVTAVAVWTSPAYESDTSAKLGVGFETKVRVANHIGWTGGSAKLDAARIGYVLCEGDPASPTPIPDGDTRIVDSYHSSSPPPGTLVTAGAYVGVVLFAPAPPGKYGAGALVAAAVVGAVVGAACAAYALKSKR